MPYSAQFPVSAAYPAAGQQPPVLTTRLGFTGNDGCAGLLASVTYDATRPVVTMTEVSERFGSPADAPAARRRSLLANETTLFVLMLFNFSKPGGPFSALNSKRVQVMVLHADSSVQ